VHIFFEIRRSHFTCPIVLDPLLLTYMGTIKCISSLYYYIYNITDFSIYIYIYISGIISTPLCLIKYILFIYTLVTPGGTEENHENMPE
jgi:hypothetical protein